MIVKPNDTKFSITEKQEVLTWRNTWLRQVKSDFDNNFNLAKVNVQPQKTTFLNHWLQRNNKWVRNL